ncbi:LOW QUALITY PROTEIN: Lipase [Gryllus bimaculatus]|nr:LOW QUALITY PROTEIN: Lipase [Gryllus bimaculatus]
MALSIGVLGLGLLASAFASYNIDQDVHLDTVGLLRKYGYPAEAHEVTTADGYILTLHRVPHSPSSPPGGRGAGGRRPVVFLQHGLVCSSADWVVMGPGVAPANFQIGYNEVKKGNPQNTIFGTICRHKLPYKTMCDNLIYFLCGYDPEELNSTMLPVLMSHTPAGASSKTLLHFLQEILSDEFQMWDYGLTNIFHYGSLSPPKYNVSKVTVPVAIHYSIGDRITGKTDVDRLFRNTRNTIGKFQVPKDHFSHMDFVWGVHSKELIYDLIIGLMSRV